jgi:hypothetical protein
MAQRKNQGADTNPDQEMLAQAQAGSSGGTTEGNVEPDPNSLGEGEEQIVGTDDGSAAGDNPQAIDSLNEEVDPEEEVEYQVVGRHDFGGGDVVDNGTVVKLTRGYAGRFPGKFKPMAVVAAERDARLNSAKAREDASQEFEKERVKQSSARDAANSRTAKNELEKGHQARLDRIRAQERNRVNTELAARQQAMAVTPVLPKGADAIEPVSQPAPGSGLPGPAGFSVTSDTQRNPH